MKKLQLDSIKEMLTKEQIKNGSERLYRTNNHCPCFLKLVMRYILIILFAVSCFSKLFAQTRITGKLIGYDNIDSCDLFLPIGAYYNSFLPVKKPINNHQFSFDIPIEENSLLTLRFGGRPVYLYLKPGGTVELEIYNTNNKNDFLKIKGDNATGILWYNIYNYLPATNFDKPNGITESLKEKSEYSVLNSMKNFISKEEKPIDSLFHEGLIDSGFAVFCKKELRVFYNTLFIKELSALEENALLKQKSFRLKQLLYTAYPIREDMLKGRFGKGYFLSEYLSDLKRLHPELADKRPEFSFGPYDDYFLLPDFYLEYLLGDAIALDKLWAANTFDFDKGYTFFRKRFPESLYLPLIDKLIASEKISVASAKVKLDTAIYTSLEQVIQRYKGDNLFIDLWATWCIPCKQEFPYYADIRQELEKRNIIPVFISIDRPELKNTWKKVAGQLNLEGFNLIAGKQLYDNLQMVVYKEESFSIPRYILVNKKGEVVDLNAPRPSDKESLMKVFENKL